MKPRIQIALGLAATAILVVLDEMLSYSGTALLAVVAILSIFSVIRRERLPMFVRVFSTGATFYLGYLTCLIGRTMEPGFTGYGVWMSLLGFGIYASLPMLALLCIWRGRFRLAIVAGMFPVCLALASAVAAYEEHLFVQQHRNGVGPTARWTVLNHWLAYDAETQRLSGSD